MRPHLSLCSQRVPAPSTIVTAMLSVAGTRWKHKSGVIFASIGEICGLEMYVAGTVREVFGAVAVEAAQFLFRRDLADAV